MTTTLIDLFAASVKEFSDRIAVSDDQESLTYQELDGRANAVARQLRDANVTAGEPVALCLERRVGLVVAILGVLKAGAAYLAIDGRYPEGRRRALLDRGGARVVLADDSAGDLAGTAERTVLRPSDATEAETPGSRPGSGSAASILFTSGSTGAPKGIVLTHGNLAWFSTNPSLPALRSTDRTGQVSNISFDAFHFELWRTLAAGAELVILPPVRELLSVDFQRQMRRRRISVMLVPTMVASHVVNEDREAFSSLRLLHVGGDVLAPATVRALLHGGFAGELYNLYGPAEGTTACVAHRVTEADAAANDVPIGRPLDGVTLYVLSPELKPVADGVIGELVIGGPNVAKGYLDPAHDADSFVANPVASLPTSVYRTGDLVVWDDGVLRFRGRSDTQVKIRGYRVELAEVERSLLGAAHVLDSAVVACGSGEDQSLVGVVVGDGRLSLAELRVYAENELPDYLVPSEIILVDEFPVTAHGKRDVAALREMVAEHRQRAATFVPPQTEAERYLAVVWQQLLVVEQVGREDSFVELGGHSLQVFRMQRRIKRDRDVVIPHQELMSTLRLRDLASLLDRHATAEGEPISS